MNAPRPLPPLPDVAWAPIVRIAAERVRQPLRAPFRTALREVRELAGWSLALETSDVVRGSGTTVATPPITGHTDAIIERDPSELSLILRRCRSLTGGLAATARSKANSSARAAADLACTTSPDSPR